MICLVLPLIISFVIVLIWIVLSGSIFFSGDDFLRIAGILLTSIIYLSAIYLIGLLISAGVHRTATALMLSLFIWVVLILVYPSVSVFAVSQLTRERDSKINSSFDAIWQIQETVNKEEREYLKNDGVNGESDRFLRDKYLVHIGVSAPEIANHIEFKSYDWRVIAPGIRKIYSSCHPLPSILDTATHSCRRENGIGAHAGIQADPVLESKNSSEPASTLPCRDV